MMHICIFIICILLVQTLIGIFIKQCLEEEMVLMEINIGLFIYLH